VLFCPGLKHRKGEGGEAGAPGQGLEDGGGVGVGGAEMREGARLDETTIRT